MASAPAVQRRALLSTPHAAAVRAADAAVAAIQQVNDITIAPDRLPYPPMVSAVTAPLTAMVDELPKTLRHLSITTRRQLSMGLIHMDDGADAGEAASALLQLLGQAGDEARALSDTLHKTVAALSRMSTEARA
ncbi:hypothetical protein [Streptomyces sp. UNOC14_S4]|uniref:hypothetical protein n=1 Tax=Streptomyces sp. UNOC14_S4 TaxID=2872340 RepID=UPI001E3AC793|nr:hypothetical protein [Streptomyces sp. UNOC14_S4]MCC3767286.1 hypothetical protein [Streptomyces sp. UNOC14_S4]